MFHKYPHYCLYNGFKILVKRAMENNDSPLNGFALD